MSNSTSCHVCAFDATLTAAGHGEQSHRVMYCPACGKENAEGSSFCSQCDAALLNSGKLPELGPYRLKAKLGEGGMGVVYLAHDTQLDRDVALKVLHPQLLKHKDFLERFRREARMHAKLIHPNIVTLLSLYEDKRHLALVMEMIHGQDLKQYLRLHSRPDLREVERISLAVLHGLAAAHAVDLVHRDLKPANVLLGDDGSIKLTDFGLAKPKHGEEDLTQSGATVGSYRYMAPEQIANQPVDARSDLYAFGILLYQMCTGRLPFESSAGGGGEFEIMEKQVRHMPAPPHEINATLPRALSDLIMSLLAKQPGRRPGSCAEVERMLLYAVRQAEAASWDKIGRGQNNIEIAKDLVLAFGRMLWRRMAGIAAQGRQYLWRLPLGSLERICRSVRIGLPPRFRAVVPEAWQTPLLLIPPALAVLALVLWLAWPVQPSQVLPESEGRAETAAKPVAPVKEAAQQAEQPRPKPAQAAPVAAKPVAKPPARAVTTGTPAKKKIRPITFTVSHRVMRSDRSTVNPKDSHEFRGGKHLYFPELASYRWKENVHVFKKGWVRLYLDKPQHLSSIIIHSVSVGKADFTGGEIILQVSDSHGRWQTLLQREDRDIGQPVNVDGPAKYLADVAGVRLRFKSPEPISVGPIDLLP